MNIKEILALCDVGKHYRWGIIILKDVPASQRKKPGLRAQHDKTEHRRLAQLEHRFYKITR